MPTTPATFQLATEQSKELYFSISQLGASQTDLALKMNANAATSGSLNVVGVPFNYAGHIVGIRMSMTANKTAGVFSITPTINGTKITAPAKLVTALVAVTTKQLVVQDEINGAAAFKAGDLIGVKITTDGSYAPTTNDVVVIVDVILHNVEI